MSGSEQNNLVQIRRDNLQGEEIAALLREHLDHMHEITPADSVHALDLAGLSAPDITFWSAWNGDELLGCGALKELDEKSGEVKSMRTVTTHLRQGVGSKILEHIIRQARQRHYQCLYLETGSMDDSMSIWIHETDKSFRVLFKLRCATTNVVPGGFRSHKYVLFYLHPRIAINAAERKSVNVPIPQSAEG